MDVVVEIVALIDDDDSEGGVCFVTSMPVTVAVSGSRAVRIVDV